MSEILMLNSVAISMFEVNREIASFLVYSPYTTTRRCGNLHEAMNFLKILDTLSEQKRGKKFPKRNGVLCDP